MDQDSILQESYWKERIRKANERNEIHKSVYICGIELWEKIEVAHKKALKKYIQEDTSIIDIGCGYGRLLSLLPQKWRGNYLGVDISPDMIDIAKKTYPDYADRFLVSNVENLEVSQKFDLAIMISFRPMIIRHLGLPTWETYLTKIESVSKERLYLEYSTDERGTLES